MQHRLERFKRNQMYGGINMLTGGCHLSILMIYYMVFIHITLHCFIQSIIILFKFSYKLNFNLCAEIIALSS